MNSYFPHDSNARNSDKLLPVRMKYGAEGYGIYFMLLERLREEKNYMSVKDYNVLAFDLRVDTSKIKDLVENFGLFAFTENGECFYSEGFNKRMEIKDEKSKKRSEAGKKGAAKRWQKDSNVKSGAMAMPSNYDSKETKVKETKLNKTKDNHHDEKSPLRLANEYWGQNRPLNSVLQDAILRWCNQWPNEMIVYAMELTYNNSVDVKGVKPYISVILKKWADKNIDTLEKAKANTKPKKTGYSNKRVEQLPDHIANPKTEDDVSALARQKLIDLGVTPND